MEQQNTFDVYHKSSESNDYVLNIASLEIDHQVNYFPESHGICIN